MARVVRSRLLAVAPGTVLLLVLLNLGLAGLVWALAVVDVETAVGYTGHMWTDPAVEQPSSPAVLADRRMAAAARTDRGAFGPLDQTLARPLFRPDRRPSVAAPARATSNASEASALPVMKRPPPAVSLFGIMTLSGGASRVLVRRSGEASGSWYAPGDEIEGWRLAHVDRAEITLSLDSERHVLALAKPDAAGR